MIFCKFQDIKFSISFYGIYDTISIYSKYIILYNQDGDGIRMIMILFYIFLYSIMILGWDYIILFHKY